MTRRRTGQSGGGGADLAESVYAAVRLVPPGTVVTYGDLADLFGTSPRLVGRLMSGGSDVELPWWRVVSAAGTLPLPLRAHARERWREEGTPLRVGRDGLVAGVALPVARADLPALGTRAEAALGPLPGLAADGPHEESSSCLHPRRHPGGRNHPG